MSFGLLKMLLLLISAGRLDISVQNAVFSGSKEARRRTKQNSILDLYVGRCCRVYWDERSRSLVTLLSVVTALIWAVAWLNVLAHCHWSRLLCGAAQVPCAFVVLYQVYVQVRPASLCADRG